MDARARRRRGRRVRGVPRRRAAARSVVEFRGPLGEAHAGTVVVVAGPAAAFGDAHLGDGHAVLVDLEDRRQRRAPKLVSVFRWHVRLPSSFGWTLVESESMPGPL